jgi:hypothetical protein
MKKERLKWLKRLNDKLREVAEADLYDAIDFEEMLEMDDTIFAVNENPRTFMEFNPLCTVMEGVCEGCAYGERNGICGQPNSRFRKVERAFYRRTLIGADCWSLL